MRIQMIYGVLGTDLVSWNPGEVHDAPEAFARWLIERKKAKPAPAVVRPVAVEPEPVEEKEEVQEPAVPTRKRRRSR